MSRASSNPTPPLFPNPLFPCPPLFPPLIRPLFPHSTPQPPRAPQKQPTTHKNDDKIKHHERNHNTNISPPMTRQHAKAARKLLSTSILAEPTLPICECLNIPSGLAHKRRHVLRTPHAIGGREASELVRGTANGNVLGENAEESFEEVAEGGEMEHPFLPEGRHGSIGHDDTTEGDHEQEENRDKEGGEEFVGGEGSDRLAEAKVVQFE
jgi:hypothetical protein